MKTFLLILDIASHLLLMGFGVIFGLLAFTGIALTLIEQDAFNLIGAGFSAFISWICWSVRK